MLERAKLFVETDIEEAKSVAKIIRVQCLVDIALNNISMAEEVTKKINALYSENSKHLGNDKNNQEWGMD